MRPRPLLVLAVLSALIGCTRSETPAPKDQPGAKTAPAAAPTATAPAAPAAAPKKDAGLPPAVEAAVKARYPAARIAGTPKREVDDGKVRFELSLTQDKDDWRAEFAEDGSLIAEIRPVELAKVPAEVRDAVAAKYPGAKLDDLAGVGKSADGKVIRYDLTVRHKDKRFRAEVSPDGKKIEEEDAD
jgi:hypothetical protein